MPRIEVFDKDTIDENTEKLNNLKDKHKGEDIYILGTGPTLTEDFIDVVRDKVTISTNGIVYANNIWDFEPTYFIGVDPCIFQEDEVDDKFIQGNKKTVYANLTNFKNTIQVYSDRLLQNHLYKKRIGHPSYKHYNDIIQLCKNNIYVTYFNEELFNPPYTFTIPLTEDRINFNLLNGTLITGSSITSLAIPLAVWLGSKRIFIKGCGIFPRGHFYKKDKNQVSQKRREKLTTDMREYMIYKNKLYKSNIDIFSLDSPPLPGLEYYKI